MKPLRLLSIAGSDSGGGAGIQADLKVFTNMGTHGMTVLTALTAQNTVGVQGIHPVPVEFVRLQLQSVFTDIGVDAVKTGMLADPAIVKGVATELEQRGRLHLVVDPVLVTTTGHSLAAAGVATSLKENLFPLATIITPNIPEAEALTGVKITDFETMVTAAQKLLAFGSSWVLIKGGHLNKDTARDLLTNGEITHWLRAPWIATPHTHGTGCSLAAAIAVGLAQGLEVPMAVAQAKQYVWEALQHAFPLGSGVGPVFLRKKFFSGQDFARFCGINE